MVLFPSYLRYKISGKNAGYPSLAQPGEQRVKNIVINRTLYFDNIINKSKDKAEQFVVMGAGLDTRCYGEFKNSNVNAHAQRSKDVEIQEQKSPLLLRPVSPASTQSKEADYAA